jgi:hypothetical protein
MSFIESNHVNNMYYLSNIKYKPTNSMHDSTNVITADRSLHVHVLFVRECTWLAYG